MEIDVYWDTLYDKTYVESENVLYTANNSFSRFLDSLLEAGENAIYVVDDIDRMYFAKYGWNINYKIASHIEKLPNFAELGEFSAKDYYYIYNNELSKDIGLDLSEYAGKDVSVEIYQLRESMPEKFHPIDNARGIVIKYENEIIGAYISAGRHQVENACSLYGKTFDEIIGQSFGSYISTLLQEETELKSKTPEEIIKLYFNALNEKDEQTAGKCISKLDHFSDITANILNTELYDDTLQLPLTNKTFIEVGEKRIDNIMSISNLEIKPYTENKVDEKHKAYIGYAI